jgi:glucosamine-6-phosphate deaminase
MHREEGLSFGDVALFNAEQYYPMAPEEVQSQARELDEYLISQIDLKEENIHLLDGTVDQQSAARYCREYEELIENAGGLDLALVGIGHGGHLAFNGAGSGKESRTRVVHIDRIHRSHLAGDFFGTDNVPRKALTLGLATILEARRLLLPAMGGDKAAVIREIAEGEGPSALPAAALRDHPDAALLLEEAAARELTRYRSPWLLGPVEWDSKTSLRAVKMLSLSTGKAILKLTAGDYAEGGLQDLLATEGSAYKINLRIFRHFQSTITGWPGGKPPEAREAGDRPGDRPGDRDDIFPKKILVFSPHPDDDVISMGGTLIRLVDQGHEVHVAYQTSGNIAVFDEDALGYTDFVTDFCDHFGIRNEGVTEIDSHVDRFLRNKKPGQMDSTKVQDIKGMIRRNEARAAARCCGIPEEQLHFLDLPFYRTGSIRKQAAGEEDTGITAELLRNLEPHQIYAAGDLSDPHGTHRTCLSILLKALGSCAGEPWHRDCVVWLYRGAWQEWPLDEIEMAVPLSPQEVERKRMAIFKHESQKDRALFPGSDTREFWQRSEARNAETARLYDSIGLAEYEAIEGFVRWDGQSGISI